MPAIYNCGKMWFVELLGIPAVPSLILTTRR
jgi:hypothetical protein